MSLVIGSQSIASWLFKIYALARSFARRRHFPDHVPSIVLFCSCGLDSLRCAILFSLLRRSRSEKRLCSADLHAFVAEFCGSRSICFFCSTDADLAVYSCSTKITDHEDLLRMQTQWLIHLLKTCQIYKNVPCIIIILWLVVSIIMLCLYFKDEACSFQYLPRWYCFGRTWYGRYHFLFCKAQ